MSGLKQICRKEALYIQECVDMVVQIKSATEKFYNLFYITEEDQKQVEIFKHINMRWSKFDLSDMSEELENLLRLQIILFGQKNASKMMIMRIVGDDNYLNVVKTYTPSEISPFDFKVTSHYFKIVEMDL